jgi:hypothetical protein
MNEAQVRWNHADDATGLPGQLKVGAWFHSADFAASFGDKSYWGDSGYYAIVDQMLYREPGKEAPAPVTSKDGKSIIAANDGKSTKSFKESVKLEPSNQSLGWFGRISFDPQDRNFVGFCFDTGLVYTGLMLIEFQHSSGFVCFEVFRRCNFPPHETCHKHRYGEDGMKII